MTSSAPYWYNDNDNDNEFYFQFAYIYSCNNKNKISVHGMFYNIYKLGDLCSYLKLSTHRPHK